MGGTALAPQHVISIKPRTYRHIDPPLSKKRREAFSASADQVARHSFLPFVGFDQIERRIDFEEDSHWKITSKSRPIRFASHNDSAIHALYAFALAEAYEAQLSSRGLSECVLAYRSGIGSNINFAKSLFDEVKEHGNWIVLCFDITKFFDSLDHRCLERAILDVLKHEKLSKDWVKVFKRLTAYEWVDSKALRRVVPRSTEPHRICSIAQFRDLVRPIIQTNSKTWGIPQGSPLSGILANVYMLTLDERMCAFVRALGGSYRRYSDDIAIIIPNGKSSADIEMALSVMLSGEFLSLKPSKTTRTAFVQTAGVQTHDGDELQYLGFTFDGSRILLRSSSLKRFFKKMKAAIRVAVRAAANAGYPESEIRRRTIVGKYTHWGDRKNFVQYAYRASRIMDAPEIRRQLRNHVRIFNATFLKYRERYYHRT